MHIEIQTKERWYIPVLIGKVRWSWSRSGSPGKIEFTVKKDAFISFGSGAAVLLKIDGKVIFRGFVFTKRRKNGPGIDCTAYDQIRYLKNTMTLKTTAEDTAAGVVRKMAERHSLEVGEIEGDESATLAPYLFEGKEILEIIDHVAAQHAITAGETMILYDDAGKLCFKSLLSMQVTDQVFTAAEMEDWDYETTIDRGTYNSIAVEFIDEDGVATDSIYEEDLDRMGEWGVLRYTAQTNEPAPVAREKAKKLLAAVNREVRSLKLQNVIGNLNVRGGSLVAVRLPLGDMELFNWMIVREVTHTIEGGRHSMSMTVENNHLGFAPAISPEGIFKMLKKDDKKGSGGGGRLPGNTNQEKIWNELRDLGFSAAATAGILGNMHRETGGTFDPGIIQGDGRGPGIGLCQWESKAMGGSGRWEPLVAWCNANGFVPKGIEGQCAFINYELTDQSQWIANFAMGHYAGMSGTDFKVLEDVDKATRAFLEGYEIGPPAAVQDNYNKSIGPARMYYDQWAQYGTGGGQGTGVLAWPFPAVAVGSYSIDYPTSGWRSASRPTHMGIDTGGPGGSPIVAADGGTVTLAEWHYSYGNFVEISHGGPDNMATRYAHLSRIDVHAGQAVSKGQQVGACGTTGESTGNHLHFEVRLGHTAPWGGRDVNPLNYF